MKPHKHAELIKKWADGAVIQFRSSGDWQDIGGGVVGWYENYEYRIKPEPKPDVVKYGRIVQSSMTTRQTPADNLMVIYDGETGNPKDAKVLK